MVSMPSSSGTSRRTLLGGAAALLAAPALAQTPWPSRPLRLVVPFAPGGGADNQARLVADALSRRLGQNIVVENRGGAGGTLAAQNVATAPADGYTLFYGTPGQLTINPILMRDLPYDPVRDFAPVSLITRSSYALAVNPAVPATSLQALIALAKAQPGRLAYSSSGVGSGPHLAGELFRLQAGIDITHAPYRGSGPALQDLVAGNIPISFDSLSVLIPLLREGKVRGLGVTTARRNPLLPDLPAIAEVLPGYEVTVFNFIAVRSGTPEPIIARLSREIAASMQEPQIRQRNDGLGVESLGTTPEVLAQVLRDEATKWRDVITRAGIRVE
jgi:tripartite-type tricarboxylate transporter receptor subunit TctC